MALDQPRTLPLRVRSRSEGGELEPEGLGARLAAPRRRGRDTDRADPVAGVRIWARANHPFAGPGSGRIGRLRQSGRQQRHGFAGIARRRLRLRLPSRDQGGGGQWIVGDRRGGARPRDRSARCRGRRIAVRRRRRRDRLQVTIGRRGERDDRLLRRRNGGGSGRRRNSGGSGRRRIGRPRRSAVRSFAVPRRGQQVGARLLPRDYRRHRRRLGRAGHGAVLCRRRRLWNPDGLRRGRGVARRRRHNDRTRRRSRRLVLRRARNGLCGSGHDSAIARRRDDIPSDGCRAFIAARSCGLGGFAGGGFRGLCAGGRGGGGDLGGAGQDGAVRGG